MDAPKDISEYIQFCREYSDSTMIPSTLRDKSVVLYSYQGVTMGLPPSTRPDAYLYNPFVNGPELCSGSPDIQYGRIPIEGTTLDIYLGPVFPFGITEKILRQLMLEQVVSLDHKDELREYVMHIPTITRSQLVRHMIFVNSCLNNTPASFESILKVKEASSLVYRSHNFDSEDDSSSDLPLFESRMYNIVSTGNQKELSHFFNSFSGNIRGNRLAASELRHNKNELIVNAAKLVSLSAVPAGVSPREASRLAALYINECENLRTVEEVDSLHYSMLLDFCSLCANASLPSSASRELSDCIGYIRTHVNESISVADVAGAIRRSESYTMKLFHDELNITINKFVNRCKLEESKSLLSHTTMPLAEISEYLCFSSQSYFQNLFKKKYGITPNEYRKKAPRNS